MNDCRNDELFLAKCESRQSYFKAQVQYNPNNYSLFRAIYAAVTVIVAATEQHQTPINSATALPQQQQQQQSGSSRTAVGAARLCLTSEYNY